MTSEDNTRPDPFDRIIGDLTGLPDHTFARASTVTTVTPILGRAQTYVIRTCRAPGGAYIGFIEMVEADRHIRIVIPEKAMAAIYRQRDGLVTASRRSAGRERYAREHPEWTPKPKGKKKRAAVADTTNGPSVNGLRDLLKF